MSNPISIQVHSPLLGSGDSAAPSRPALPAASPAVTAATDTKPVQFFVNPSFRFDPSVGLAVIEFRDNHGNLSSSIPSQRQLEAYRTHQELPPGEKPQTPQPIDGKTPPG